MNYGSDRFAFEGVKLLFDTVLIGIVDPTALSNSGEGSPIATLIDEKLGIEEIVFLVEFPQKRSRRISAMPTKQRNVENYLCFKFYCNI
ncbi:hypothetical protein SAMN05216285_3886 [Natrinema salifodinae]|uniref:Uncharacterized protein n=1 Tax=Natrinema salifodinae TaxID=1202768 RepID=A0A1I0QTF6_9EURY|nr:hypothetical protein SAMN05216285_3886 [Natrinema salifodinae]